MGRAISDKFMNDLKSGGLSDLLEAVHNDTNLIMELRGNSVIIYYRGGALFTVNDSNGEYQVSYNPAYWEIRKKYDEMVEMPSISDCVKYIALYKDQMDYHMANSKRNLEKQCQQHMVMENNILGKVVPGDKANKSFTTGDYFILDIEYAFKDGKNLDARFDALALKWPSLAANRKKRRSLGISFVELKYYDGAMAGRSGIIKHIGDYLRFVKRPEYIEMCRDMEKVFYQKCELGLIPSYTSRLKTDSEKYYNISIDEKKPEFIFIFANRDPDSAIAKRELNAAIEEYGSEAVKD
ncbi:MAG: hypothetical protein K5770_20280, partial [Lachnospiraceae bacterium]|nr:hypothetical protein [Lachnospiraceae bacterium]